MSRIAPTFPATQATPNTTSVTTQTGFSQGDLVYFNNGDYKSPANLTAPSAITIGAPQPQLVLSGGAGGVGIPVFSSTDYQTSDAYGSSQAQSMAVLTNGNIVQVFRSQPNNYPSFRIINSSGTIVVAATAISTSATFVNSSNLISVSALTGGGFAVMFYDSSVNPSFAVYTNSGSVTTAATSDSMSTTGNAQLPIQMTSLANGGFAVCTVDSSNNLNYKIYTSTGGTTVTWTVAWGQGSQSYGYNIASRSDSSICIAGYYSSGSYNAYAIFSATGTTIVARTSAGQYSQSILDLICLADGTTFVFGFWDNYTSPSYNLICKLLPTGNTLGSAIKLVSINNIYTQTSGNVFTFLRLYAQSGGGFAVFTSDIRGLCLYVSFYNSTATVAYPASNSNGVVPLNFINYTTYYSVASSYYVAKGTVYENGGNIYFAYSNQYYSCYNYNYISINTSTYAFNANPSATSLSSVSPTISTSSTTGSLITSSTTPTKLNYYAGASSSIVATSSVSTVLSPTLLDSFTVSSITSTTLSDGRFAIGYANQSGPYAITVKVFSSSGGLLQTIKPGNTNTVNYQSSVKLFALANGKLGVAWLSSASAGTNINVNIYSSSYSVVASGTSIISGNSTNSTYWNDSYGWDIKGNLATDQIIVMYPGTSNYLYWTIFSNSLVSVGSPVTIVSGTSWYAPQITPIQQGGMLMQWFNGSSNLSVYGYYPTSSSTYQLYSTGSFTASTNPYANQSKNVSTVGNYVMIIGNSGTNQFYPYTINPYANTFGSNYQNVSLPSFSGNLSGGGAAFGGTGYGTFTLAYYTSTGASGSMRVYGGINFNSLSLTNPSQQYIDISCSIYTGNQQITITPGVAYSSVIAWSDANQYPNYMIVNTCPLYVPYAVTSGVTVSNPVTISPAPNTSGISNAALVGVANNTAAAGASASLTTNGPVTLNTNYSASTAFQSFDYQLPNGGGIQGVKGTIVGRNVNLFGNN